MGPEDWRVQMKVTPTSPPPQNGLTSACSFNLTRPCSTALSFCWFVMFLRTQFCTGEGNSASTFPYVLPPSLLLLLSPHPPPPPLPLPPLLEASYWTTSQSVWQSLRLYLSHTQFYLHVPALVLLGQCVLSPSTLNDLSIMSWCVHHFCFHCGSESI